MKKALKKVTTHTIAFVLGAIVFIMIGAYAASTLSSSSVYYDNSTSGGSSTNVSGAVYNYGYWLMNASSSVPTNA